MHPDSMSSWTEGPLVGFDLKTTGTDPYEDRIVTAYVGLQPSPTSSWSGKSLLLDPGVYIPPSATAVHKIKNERARRDGLPTRTGIALILQLLKDMTEGGTIPLVVFNASFDLTMIHAEAERHELKTGHSLCKVIDPLVLDRKVNRYRKGSRTLSLLCDAYQLGDFPAHESTADAQQAVSLARAIGRSSKTIGETDPLILASQQASWAATQRAELQAHLRRRNPMAVVDSGWPRLVKRDRKIA